MPWRHTTGRPWDSGEVSSKCRTRPLFVTKGEGRPAFMTSGLLARGSLGLRGLDSLGRAAILIQGFEHHLVEPGVRLPGLAGDDQAVAHRFLLLIEGAVGDYFVTDVFVAG